MNVRIFRFVLAATLLPITGGCCGMGDFLFGRGARCGLCNRFSAAGNALNPLAPAPGHAPAPQPCYPPHAAPPTCGVPPYAPAYGQPAYGQPAYGAPACGTPGGYLGSGYAGADCNCGNPVVRGYGGVVDPYLGGGYINGGAMGDNFFPRQFDADGNEIISVSPPITN